MEEAGEGRAVEKVVKRLILFEHLVRLFSCSYCAVQLYLWIQIYHLDEDGNRYPNNTYAKVQLLHLFTTVGIFSLNIGLITYFCKMGQFFIETMSDGGELRPQRTKVFTVMMVSLITVIQLRNLVIETQTALIVWLSQPEYRDYYSYGGDEFESLIAEKVASFYLMRFSDEFIVINRILSYLSQLLPFLISFFVMKIVRFFATDEAAAQVQNESGEL